MTYLTAIGVFLAGMFIGNIFAFKFWREAKNGNREVELVRGRIKDLEHFNRLLATYIGIEYHDERTRQFDSRFGDPDLVELRPKKKEVAKNTHGASNQTSSN